MNFFGQLGKKHVKMETKNEYLLPDLSKQILSRSNNSSLTRLNTSLVIKKRGINSLIVPIFVNWGGWGWVRLSLSRVTKDSTLVQIIHLHRPFLTFAVDFRLTGVFFGFFLTVTSPSSLSSDTSLLSSPLCPDSAAFLPPLFLPFLFGVFFFDLKVSINSKS